MHNISSHFCINKKIFFAFMNIDSLHQELELCYHNKIFLKEPQIVTTAHNENI